MVYKRVRLRAASFLIIFLCSSALDAAEVRVAVASNFAPALRVLADVFASQSEHQVVIISGSSGKHYAQILNGAPYDVLLAADSLRPKRLVQKGAAISGSRFTYAIGKLVLWGPKQAEVNFESLNSNFDGKLAIANPLHAPYGLAAQQALEHLERWESVSPQLVRGENVAQAFQFVATGNAAFGLVALSQLQGHPLKSFWTIPQDYYQPIEQQAVLLSDNPAASAILTFLKTPVAQKIIQDYGYATR